ncbi:MAG: hypothetical protein QOJ51_1350 [Acidobacteriaceae bacterium]|nr:hypothetical protein [Acidobacteriaceae bacterium]MEA2258525.1 hypothetical protein [Acidobacteriaceae bacterium]
MSTSVVCSPNWRPLERLFSAEECSNFMYMGRSGSIELYKHRETRRYLNIHAESGEFYLHGNRTPT